MNFLKKQTLCGKNVILKTIIIIAEVSIFLQNASRIVPEKKWDLRKNRKRKWPIYSFLVPVDADDILRLDVQVDDAPGVQVGQPCQTFLTVTNTLSSFSTSENSFFFKSIFLKTKY